MNHVAAIRMYLFRKFSQGADGGLEDVILYFYVVLKKLLEFSSNPSCASFQY